MSASAVCSECAAWFAIFAGADTDAPLATCASVSVRFRFASDGDAGAGGSDGGVRAPLAEAMVMGVRAVRDAGAMPSRRATRSGPPDSRGAGPGRLNRGARAARRWMQCSGDCEGALRAGTAEAQRTGGRRVDGG